MSYNIIKKTKRLLAVGMDLPVPEPKKVIANVILDTFSDKPQSDSDELIEDAAMKFVRSQFS